MFGTTHGERLTGKAVDFKFQRPDPDGEFCRHARQFLAVDADALPLHLSQNRDQRPVDGFIDPGDPVRRQARRQMPVQPQRHIGIFGGIGRRRLDRHLPE